MELKKEAAEIQKVVQSYAAAYEALQEWQEKSPLIPIGDQKTGCIGEFYVYLYLTHRFPESTLSYGNHSKKGWDILVSNPEQTDVNVQVKTVSSYSTTRIISPIHHGWDELHLVYLNKKLEPEGFWIVRNPTVVGKDKPLTGTRSPIPGKVGTGSKNIDFGDNLIENLRESISCVLIGYSA